MNDFLSLRNNNRPKTQAEVDALMANEPDVLPAYGGAGSMAAHLKRASKQYRPTNSRARLTAAERAQFAAENQEVTPMTPEQEAHIHAEVAKSLQKHEFKEYFARAVRNNTSLTEAWNNSGIDGECPFFAGVERDGDPAGAHEHSIITAWLAFARSPIFAAYAYNPSDKQSPRYKVAAQINSLLWQFIVTNLVNPTIVGSWAACFALLERIGVLPAPVPTTEQLRAAERSKPADDGNPVALHENGEPVTYVKNGQTIRYSNQMLSQLTSRGYEIVMGLKRVNPQVTRPVEAAKTNDAGQPMGANDYRNRVVGDTGKTQAQLDAMTSEEYRLVMKLSRNPRAMAPAEPLR